MSTAPQAPKAPNKSSKIWALIPCGGNGTRADTGTGSPKQYRMIAGKPMVMHLQHFEAMLYAQQVVKLGAGLLPQPATAASIAQALHDVMAQPSYAAAAQRFASQYSTYSHSQVIQIIAAQALGCIASL